MLTYFFLLGFVKVKPMYFSVEMVARIFESTKDWFMLNVVTVASFDILH